MHEAHPLLGDHAQQPFDVVACRAQHGVQPVALLTLEGATVHAVIALEVADDGLDGLAPLELFSVLAADAFGFAPVHDMHIRVASIHAPIAQVNERGRRL